MARLPCCRTAVLVFSLAGAPAMAEQEAPRAEDGTARPLARVGAYLQAAVNDFPVGDYLGLLDLNGAESLRQTVSLGLRHAQLVVDGTPHPALGYSLRLEARNSALEVSEGHATLGAGWLRFALGRIRAPLGAESLAEDWDLPAIGRAQYMLVPIGSQSRGQPFGAFTDNAIQATARSGLARLLAWAGMSDVAGRLEFRPASGVALGGFYLASNPLLPPEKVQVQVRPGTPPDLLPHFRDRWGGDVRWQDGPVLLAAEFLRGYELGKSGGIYGYGARQYLMWNLGGGHHALLRHEDLRSDSDVIGRYPGGLATRVEVAILGWVWVIPGTGSKLQVEYHHGFSPSGWRSHTITSALGIKL